VKITVLAYQEPKAAELDVAIGQVVEALTAAGHEPSTLAIHNDVAELVSGLERNKPELVFNLVESFGDDIIGGQMGVTGILDLMQLRYTGGGPGELYLQEDKALAKKLLAYEEVLYPDYATFAPGAEFETGGNLRMPLFVKPLRMDASLGIDERSLVRNTQELMERVLNIQKKFGDAALAEEYIEGREFYVGVLGNQDPIVFPPIEMDFSGLPEGSLRVMDNKAKFDESSDRYQGTRAVVAKIDPALTAKFQRTALAAYRALRVRDYGRIDLRVAESGEIYVIEVNANCYLESSSEFVLAAEAHGMDYVTLINQIVELASERWKHRPVIKTRKRKKPAASRAKKSATSSET
jgi:D-alanine-D-alanine ligase